MDLDSNSFATTMLRQRVVAQIDAAREGLELEPGANTSEEMESVLYANAKSREEYMQLIATLVLHLNEKKRAALKGSQQAASNGAMAEAAAPAPSQQTEDTTSEGATNS